jgi:N-formylglutamate amidohydrolase
VHAVQIEINRTLYMDEARIERLRHFNDVRHSVARAIATLADRIADLSLA